MGTIALAVPILPATAPATQIEAGSVQSIDLQIAGQVAQLGDADPMVRRHAADALVRFGAAARPAVLVASRGDDPQIADAAQQVLRELPWWVPDDPVKVKENLQDYGQADVAQRIGIVAQLAGVPQSQPALLRLLSDEPNEDICWQIEQVLVGQPDVESLLAARRFDRLTARPAALVLAARAWLTPLASGKSDVMVDREKALLMYRRAVELEAVSPTYDAGQLDFAFDALAASAVERHQYDEAAALRRQQCKRIGVTRSTFPSPFFELLLLHADFGPLPGLADDLAAYPSDLAAPESLFILSRLYSRQGQQLMSETLEQMAFAASPRQETRTSATEFLIRHQMNVLASKECRATLSRANAAQDEDDVRARWLLSSLDTIRSDEARAADQLRIALDNPKTISLDPAFERLMRVELAKRALHLAQAKGDAAETGRELDELMRLGPLDEDAVLDVVPELKARGRGEEAEKLFQAAYQPLQAQIEGGTADATLMNDLAWLCARCGEHLDEALDLSNRAVAAEPNNAAFLDTSAEAHFRKGQAAESVGLEMRALKIQPGDPFMSRQLKRFQSGGKSVTEPNDR